MRRQQVAAQAGILNPLSVASLRRLLPARTRIDNVGVLLEQTVVERSKHKYQKSAISEVPYYEANLSEIPTSSYEYVQPYVGEKNIPHYLLVI